MAITLNVEDRKIVERVTDGLANLDIRWFITITGKVRTLDFRHHKRENEPCCPLEASYAKEMGEVVDHTIAARHYGFSSNARSVFTCTADNCLGQRDPDLRKRLLKVTGLTEQAGS